MIVSEALDDDDDDPPPSNQGPEPFGHDDHCLLQLQCLQSIVEYWRAAPLQIAILRHNQLQLRGTQTGACNFYVILL